MSRIVSLNEFLSSWLILLIPFSFVLGYCFRGFMPQLKWTAPHMLFTIMFTSTWGLRWADFLRADRYKKLFLWGLAGQFFLLPLVAYTLWILLLGKSSVYGVGLLCVAVSPAAISTIIWSSITGGDVALSVILVGVHVLLVPFTAPVMLKFFVGKSVHVPISILFVKLMWSVFIPTLVSVYLYERIERIEFKPIFSVWAKLGMLYMIVLNTSVAFSSVPLSMALFGIFAVVGLQVLLSYSSGILLGLLTGASRKERITMSYFMGMKNNGAALVMALSGFPPAATLPAALTIIWQQPLASILDRIWRWKGQRGL